MTPSALAAQVADRAEAVAGVKIRELSALTEFEDVCRLFDEIWQSDPATPVGTVELMRALTKAGNYVAGAYVGDRLVGACLAFFGAPAAATLHSHVAGVSSGGRGRSVGFALKLHQRAWALERGITTISWTFDPLVRRNAHFNLAKLGATVAEYLPNFYGPMDDAINGGEDTDRLLVEWRLDSPQVADCCAGRAMETRADAWRRRGAVVALDAGPDGRPEPKDVPERADSLLVAVPPEVEALRGTDPASARSWRAALRDVLSGLLADGARVHGFDRAGWYVVVRPRRGVPETKEKSR